jgi:5-formyltetrahydrofolate cyclo-ligase
MITKHKSDFRKSCINRLKYKSRFAKIKKDKIIVDKLIKTIYTLKPKSLLVYIPMELEVNIFPLIKRLRREKKIDIYVPYMEADSFKAVKYRLPLNRKKFGIKEPINSFFNRKIDVAIVPVVGIDGVYKRIGFGAGMYDRFFHRLNYKPTLIFTQIILCKTTEILSNDYDIQADYVITS